MALTADQGVKLGASKPKTSAVVAATAPTITTDEMAIYIGAAVPVSNPQQIVGQLDLLYRYAKNNLPSLTGTPCVLHVALAGSGNDIVMNGTVGTAPGTGDIRLLIGAGVHTGDKSHFLNRTFKRLVEVLLESNK